MAMGTRVERRRQQELFYAAEMAEAPGHPFSKRLNETLDAAGFDAFCEERCRAFYHDRLGRPSLAPGVDFRLQLIGFFEGANSERGIAWRVSDSLSLRRFLGYGLDEATPDHVTLSRTRRLLDAEMHQAIFSWVLERPASAGLLKGKTIGVDTTTLEANAAMRSIVRRQAGGTSGDVRQPAAGAGRAGQAVVAAAGRKTRAAVCAPVRDGRDTAVAGARAGRSKKETAHSSGCVQSGAAAADPAWSGNAARPGGGRENALRGDLEALGDVLRACPAARRADRSTGPFRPAAAYSISPPQLMPQVVRKRRLDTDS